MPLAFVRRFPPAVLATAFATLIAFLGIGVVDPILPVIARSLHATQAQVEMLFTTYIGLMAVTMLVSGVMATRLGARRTMLLGLGLVSLSALGCGLANGIPMLAAIRGGWGFGNAMFTSTALSIIVGASAGSVEEAITLYEAALGLGIASGPLIGGFLGARSWRYPFFGTSTLMAIAFFATLLAVRDTGRREPRRGLHDILTALRHPNVLLNALVGLSYSYGFFTILAYSPLALGLPVVTLGITYFAWGVLVAVSSVWVVNLLRPRFGPTRVLLAHLALLVLLFAALGLVRPLQGEVLLLVASGYACGIANALFTTLAIEVSPYTRSISSATYNFLRWAGAAVAPVLSGLIAQHFGPRVPFYVAAGVVATGALVLLRRRPQLDAALDHSPASQAAAR